VSHTDKHVFLSKKLRNKLKVRTGEAAGFSGWAAISGFFSYSLYWWCVSSISLPAICICFPHHCPIAPSLAYETFVFLCVLGATGYSEPSKNNLCEVCLPRGLNLASIYVLTASCEGGHLQAWWKNIVLHQQPSSPSMGASLPSFP